MLLKHAIILLARNWYLELLEFQKGFCFTFLRCLQNAALIVISTQRFNSSERILINELQCAAKVQQKQFITFLTIHFNSKSTKFCQQE